MWVCREASDRASANRGRTLSGLGPANGGDVLCGHLAVGRDQRVMHVAQLVVAVDEPAEPMTASPVALDMPVGGDQADENG